MTIKPPAETTTMTTKAWSLSPRSTQQSFKSTSKWRRRMIYKSSSLRQHAAFVGIWTTMMAALLCMGLLTQTYIVRERTTRQLRDRLRDIDHGILIYVYRGAHASDDGHKDYYDPVAELERLDDWFRRAKRSYPKLRRANGKYETYCDAAIDLVVNTTATTAKALASYEDALDHLFDKLDAIQAASGQAQITLSYVVSALAVFYFVVFLVVAINAVTAKVKQKAAVRQHATLIAGMGVPCLVVEACDQIPTIVHANTAALDAFGFAFGELVGSSADVALPGFYAACGDEAADDRASSTSSSMMNTASNNNNNNNNNNKGRKVKGLTKDGRELDLVAHVTRVSDLATGSERHIIVCQDITELSNACDELAVQKKVLSQFVHEMRNKYVPSVAILEQIGSLIDEANSDAEIKAELVAIRGDISMSIALLHEADQLVHTRLQLHKVYSGNYVSHPNVETVDLEEILEARVKAAAALGHKDVDFRFTTSYRDGLDVFVRLDMYMWTHVVNNLLSNARKHTTAGSVTLSFLGQEEGGRLTFSVVDTGRGMAPSISDRLFREEVASGDVRGVGLGLVSCRLFAEAIGGRVWLERTTAATFDTPGGSEFRFALPGRVVKLETSSPPDGSTPRDDTWEKSPETVATLPNKGVVAPFSPRQLTVVILEDSQLIRRSIIAKLKSACTRLGIRVPWIYVEHETVEAMLPTISSLTFRNDVLVTVDENLDAKGGVLKGADLIRALKAEEHFYGVIVSVSGEDDTASEHVRLGADIHWGKPLPKVDVLIETLETAFANKKHDACPTSICLLSNQEGHDDGQEGPLPPSPSLERSFSSHYSNHYGL
ncbi:hypothetical protein CTAYLR_006319 [Chrysophaeum taylorii]|uniref:histidine kinase n=1 Tax=Chrysophaeum taylorii TaxID=2483200 RepID=A0AAD7XM04_9STRA|nr:hypothetical protein CTAYLR_006319 [Chrysophaeum taylorii]